MSTPGPGGIARDYHGWSKAIFATSIVVDSPNRLLLMSGIGAEDEDDGHIHHVGDIAAQADMCFEKLGRVLASHDATFANVVKITAYVTDPEFRAPYSHSRLRAFGDHPLSTHTFVVVSRLAWPDMLVEIDATAVIPASIAASAEGPPASR